jgi:hypothetical protein
MKVKLPKPPIPENAPGYSNTAVSAAKNIDNLDLDYSVKSLDIVDGILDRFHKEGVPVEKIGATLFAFGCYVGEVFIRNFGGQWKKEDETGMKGFAGFFIVVQLPNGMTVNPIGKVFNIVMEGVPGLPYFYRVFTTEEGTKFS